MAAEPRIFVSYARGDGREFAIGLRQQLEAHGFPLWQDLADLEGGRDWWRQITEAIDACEYLVLVLTPRAVASETVRREWRYARQQGRCVVPVYGTKGLDLGPLPGWMRRTHVYDLDEPDQFRRFTRQLEGPCNATRVPRMVEELADDFVERPAELESLVAKLLDEEREELVAITAALKGAGGYGKTTLARALCHDERVQDAFHDGILWVTLGEAPGDLTGRVIDLVQVLTGERPGFTSITAATSRLAELLSDRYLLLVIDDVWHRADAEPFLQGGKTTCARLITTRNRDTLPAGTAPVDVEEMRAREAVSLLRFGLPAGGDATFEALAARLGEWPLLLKLANRALRGRVDRGQALTDALAWVGQALDRKGVQAFDPKNETERRNTAEGTIEVSLELLDPDERMRLTELAVFPEDLDVPLAAVERLWQHTGGVDPFDAEEIFNRLFDLSLLLRLDLAGRTLRLHDVVRHYLQSKADLKALHRQLVEAYREGCGGRWSEVDDDGYVLAHLIAHLIAAGQGDEARRLMFDLRWLRRKLEALGINAVLEDGGRFEDDDEVRLLTHGLQMSAHVLARDPGQLEGQILGRFRDGDAIARLIRGARAEARRPALLPLRPNLTPAGTALLRTFEVGSVVYAVAATKDGGRAISASDDRTLKLWDLDTGRLEATLEGHGAPVLTVAITPDGHRAISGSADHTLRLWDLRTGKLQATLEGHGDSVWAVAVTPDGRRAISGSWDTTLKVWDLQTNQLEATLEGHTHWVRAVAVTPDGRRAISGSSDGTLRIWDLQTGELQATLRDRGGWVDAVTVTPDGRHAILGSDNKALELWDLATSGLRATLRGHGARVTAVSVAPNGHRAISGSSDNTLKLWDLQAGKLQATFKGHGDWINAVAVTPDGQRAISGSSDNTLKLWDLQTSQLEATLEGHRTRVTAVAVTRDGQRAISGAFDNTFKLWDLGTGQFESVLKAKRAWVSAVVVTPDGYSAISSSNDRTLKIWDLRTGQLETTLAGHRLLVRAIAVLPDGHRAISGSEDSTLKLWNLGTGKLQATLEGHGGWVWAVAVTPDGRRAISGSEDKTLKLWDLNTRRLEATFEGHEERVTTVAITPDGHRAISGSADHTLRLWDLGTGKLQATLEGHSATVWAVAVTSDGHHAISCSRDKTLRIWDLARGKLLATFAAEAAFEACAVSPDGHTAVAGDAVGRVHFLKIVD